MRGILLAFANLPLGFWALAHLMFLGAAVASFWIGISIKEKRKYLFILAGVYLLISVVAYFIA